VLLLHGEADEIMHIDGARALAGKFWDESSHGGANAALSKIGEGGGKDRSAGEVSHDSDGASTKSD